MNERIKELSLQASDSIPDDVSAEHAMYPFQKKFARLIVRECAQVASDYDGAHYVGTAIEKHFGVEE
jgi:hypothetical protein